MPRGQSPGSLEALRKAREKNRFTADTSRKAIDAREKNRAKKKEIILTFAETAGKRISQETKDRIVDACAAYAQKGSLPHLEMLLKLLGEAEAEKSSDTRVEYVYPEEDGDLNG